MANYKGLDICCIEYWNRIKTAKSDDGDDDAILAAIITGAARPRGGGSYTPAPRNNRDGGKLDVDGIGGYNTTIDLQHAMGTVEDGEISGQWADNQPYHWAMDSVAYGSVGSDVVAALQRMVGADDDRQWGPETSRKLQEFLIRKGYSVGPSGADSYFGHDSVCGLQQWLNDGAPR